MKVLAILIELCGFGAIVYSGWLIVPWLAWCLAGIVLILAGQALERSSG